MLPGVSGIGVARELLREDPTRRVLALSMVSDEAHVADALQAGVLGYACKSQSAAEVMEAIRTVARGETYLAPQVSGFVVSDYRRLRNGPEASRSPLATLTAREREIFELCIQGNPTAQIAKQLGISPRTVETHRGRILRKLNAHSAVDLVRLAARWGLLEQ
jgi:two-component system response regulator NreC